MATRLRLADVKYKVVVLPNVTRHPTGDVAEIRGFLPTMAAFSLPSATCLDGSGVSGDRGRASGDSRPQPADFQGPNAKGVVSRRTSFRQL